MIGDDRARHCNQCNLDVYNLSEMTESEIAHLLANATGQRLCGRLYRRADGTLLTRDCPVGFRAVVRRVSRVAGAALSAVMSVGFAVAQTPQKDSPLTQIAPADSGIEVVVLDESGAVIANAQVFVADGKGGEVAKGISNSHGEYRSPNLSPGLYLVTVRSLGFRTYTNTVTILPHETTSLRIELALDGEAMMGVIVTVSDATVEPMPSTNVPDLLVVSDDKRSTPAAPGAKGEKKSTIKPPPK